jgi:hypothetical protein
MPFHGNLLHVPRGVDYAHVHAVLVLAVVQQQYHTTVTPVLADLGALWHFSGDVTNLALPSFHNDPAQRPPTAARAQTCPRRTPPAPWSAAH